MSTVPPPSAYQSAGRKSLVGSMFTSPLLWGCVGTFAFYQLIPVIPVQQALLERYFCSHPLEYATATLFFVGLAILAAKARRLSTERFAFTLPTLDLVQLQHDDLTGVALESTPSETAERLEQNLSGLSPRFQQSYIIRRLKDVAHHVRHSATQGQLEGHLRYLAELASERLHDSYAMVRTITWAIPIVGFLGTVIGITIAIANVTPDQLNESLNEVTSGLAVAFDTTALALALSLLMVFGAFLVERSEQQILSEVEEFGIRHVLGAFAGPAAEANSWSSAQQESAELLLEKTEELVQQQARMWRDSLNEMRSRWTETITSQQLTIDDSLQVGVAATLDDHRQQLQDVREVFLEAFQSGASQLGEQFTRAVQAQQQNQQELVEQSLELWKQISDQSTAQFEHQQSQTSQVMKSISGLLESWRAQFDEQTQQSQGQWVELREQREMLLQIVTDEQQLVRLQSRLADNLDAIRGTESLDETLHSLSAAVHLLTNRVNKTRAA